MDIEFSFVMESSIDDSSEVELTSSLFAKL